MVIFFFQAEDGIRDLTVTGVQTCALPICAASKSSQALSSEAEGMLRLFANLIAERVEREQLIASLNRTNRELAALALLDPLTGLPNRRCLTDELGRLIARCARSQECVVVGFIDLDRFKNVNDEHEIGRAHV